MKAKAMECDVTIDHTHKCYIKHVNKDKNALV